MSIWVDLKGPVEAVTIYVDDTLVARDAKVTLPAITPVTADYKAMGTMTLPLTGQIESMEFSITKVGIDVGLGRLVEFKQKTIECRWVQNIVDANGISRQEGCKAFMKAVPKTIPGLSIEQGSLSENDVTAEVLRYQLFVGGAELWLVDRLAQILRINGTDYYKTIADLL